MVTNGTAVKETTGSTVIVRESEKLLSKVSENQNESTIRHSKDTEVVLPNPLSESDSARRTKDKIKDRLDIQVDAGALKERASNQQLKKIAEARNL